MRRSYFSIVWALIFVTIGACSPFDRAILSGDGDKICVRDGFRETKACTIQSPTAPDLIPQPSPTSAINEYNEFLTLQCLNSIALGVVPSSQCYYPYNEIEDAHKRIVKKILQVSQVDSSAKEIKSGFCWHHKIVVFKPQAMPIQIMTREQVWNSIIISDDGAEGCVGVRPPVDLAKSGEPHFTQHSVPIWLESDGERRVVADISSGLHYDEAIRRHTACIMQAGSEFRSEISTLDGFYRGMAVSGNCAGKYGQVRWVDIQ